MSTQVKTGIFRAAFVNIYKPKRNEQSGKDEYGLVMLFPKDKPELIKPFRDAAVAALENKWGPDKAKWPPKLRKLDLKTYISPGGDGWPIRDGDDQEYEGFAGHVSIGAKSYEPFGVVDSLRSIMEGEALRRVKSGVQCRAVVNAAAYDNSGNKGVSFWFGALQFCKDDGVYFGGRTHAPSAFEDYEDKEGSENPDNYATGTDDF